MFCLKAIQILGGFFYDKKFVIKKLKIKMQEETKEESLAGLSNESGLLSAENAPQDSYESEVVQLESKPVELIFRVLRAIFFYAVLQIL